MVDLTLLLAVFDDRLWVIQGQTPNGNSNDVWYSSNGTDWYEVPDTPWPARHAASVFVYRDAVWLAAGSHMGSDVWRLERDHPDTGAALRQTITDCLARSTSR